jgi:nucleoid DNA-binding protein
MSSRQQEVIVKLARLHGITMGQAEEIWSSFGSTIATHISSAQKNDDGYFIEDSFPIIHIENFGKFVPNKRRIKYANHCITYKKKQNEHNTSDTTLQE